MTIYTCKGKGKSRRRMAAMNNDEFERFVQKFGKDILRFCRMTAGDAEYGDEPMSLS